MRRSGSPCGLASSRAAWVLLLFVSLLPRPLRAVVVGGGSLDWVLAHAEVVLEVRVDSIEESRSFEHLSFGVQRLQVLDGTGLIPADLRLSPAFPIWPSDLGVPYEVGTRLIVFLERRHGALEVLNGARAILPAAADVSRGGDLRARVTGELRAALDRNEDDRQRARLLVLLSEIAPRQEAASFEPHLGDSGAWSRRAALAALLRLDPTPARVRLADEDVRAFLAAPPPPEDRWFFRDLYQGALDDVHASAQAMRESSQRFLTIYRTIADADDALGLEEIGLHGLQRAGGTSDLLRLYAYATRSGPYARHQALDSLCRMLGIPLRQLEVSSYEMPLAPEVVARERRMQIAVRAALERDGLLPRDQR